MGLVGSMSLLITDSCLQDHVKLQCEVVKLDCPYSCDHVPSMPKKEVGWSVYTNTDQLVCRSLLIEADTFKLLLLF